ncbi:MAG: hypothetical protein ACRD1Z_21040 [Vicinamibacteria bacterium]
MLPSKLSVGAVYRVIFESGNVEVGFTSILKGFGQEDDWLTLSFENGVTLEGKGEEVAFRAKFYRRVW